MDIIIFSVIILCVVTSILIIFESIHILVFGKLTSDIAINIDDLYISQYDLYKKVMFDRSTMMIVSCNGSSILSKWHTDSYCIPRWSKLHKQIEVKYQELLNQM